MYRDRLPVFSSIDYDAVKAKVEPMQYAASRDTVTWASIRRVLDAEVAEMVAKGATPY